MAATLVNGRAFDFTQIIVNILNVPIISTTSIDYEETQEKINNMGTGNRPVSRGRGPIDSKATWEIAMNDIEALRAVAPNGSLLQLPAFDIVVVFGNVQSPVTHTLKFCEFTKDGVSAKQGDTDLKMTFDLIVGEIRYS